ncbi:MAG: hypothetical protein M1834_004940 [Cirrosporium novae-zelandiae]|nr:MAG: hypothetical protein M1834_004940 [Cirrosporium novae-zelandiae]
MASGQDISAKLASLQAAPQQTQVASYQEILQQICNGPNSDLSEGLSAFIDVVTSSHVTFATRPLIVSFVEALKHIGDPNAKVEVGQHALSALRPHATSFAEEDATIRMLLADTYEAQEDFQNAARALQGMNFESTSHQMTEVDKVEVWIRIVRNYLEEEDTANAEIFLNRAKNYMHKVDKPELKLYFQLSQARILDARRKFLDAAQVYLQFSFNTRIAEEERLHGLSSAIICAILAPAGPQRAVMLGRLYKDERATELEEYAILEKIYMDQLLSSEEVDRFSKKLAPHQLAQTADGSTVLAKAVLEHNLVAVSKLYENISTKELAALLGLGEDAERAEQYAARMVEQERLIATIDQIDGIIYFEETGRSGEKMNGHWNQSGVVHPELRRWDLKVEGLTEELEKVTTLLQSQFPEFVAANLVR